MINILLTLFIYLAFYINFLFFISKPNNNPNKPSSFRVETGHLMSAILPNQLESHSQINVPLRLLSVVSPPRHHCTTPATGTIQDLPHQGPTAFYSSLQSLSLIEIFLFFFKVIFSFFGCNLLSFDLDVEINHINL